MDCQKAYDQVFSKGISVWLCRWVKPEWLSFDPDQGNVEGPLAFGRSLTLAPKLEVKTGIYSLLMTCFELKFGGCLLLLFSHLHELNVQSLLLLLVLLVPVAVVAGKDDDDDD